MSKELSARGFKFVGPTIVYAFMQAVGMVNDHLVTCHRHAACCALSQKETGQEEVSRGQRSAKTRAVKTCALEARG